MMPSLFSTYPTAALSWFRFSRASWLALALSLAILCLYARPLCYPMLMQDDYQILARSWTWQQTWEGLWVPNNEHAMPLGRLLTYAVIRCAGRMSALPFASVLVGLVGIFVAVSLTFRFVQDERGHPFFAYLAAILFGVTTVYQQAVHWFAASFSVLALDTFLLALLLVQRYRSSGNWLPLAGCALCCFLAPAWFASGILAGALCGVYLLADCGLRIADCGLQKDRSRRVFFVWQSAIRNPQSTMAMVPLLGTAAFLLISLPRTYTTIQHLEHYHGATATESIHPLVGMEYTCRALVDNLLLGQLGIPQVSEPIRMQAPLAVVIVVVPLLLVLGGWWLWRAPHRRLGFLGLALIFSSYGLIYSARASWDYDFLVQVPFSRYHLFPHLGLVFLIIAGLNELGTQGSGVSGLTRGQLRFLWMVLALCLAIHLPRGLLVYYTHVPGQRIDLLEIERVDALCRKHRISAQTARQALPPLKIRASYTKIDGYTFLRGSEDPLPISVEEARRILKPPRGESPRGTGSGS